MTDDPFADLDPEWSPGSASLVWVTDRFSSNLNTLQFGDYRLGSIDVHTGELRQLAGFSTGRHTNPQFSSDGRSLYFIATPDGIPNIYRMEVNGGDIRQITNIRSGISGITPLTPALSAAASAPGIVFTVFEADRYNIYAAEPSTQPDRRSVSASDRDAAVLPPFDRGPSEVARLLGTPSAGLPPPTAYAEQDYQPRLSLDQVGQPTVGVGADRFGLYSAGGLSFLWSDMLGDHTLGTTVLLSNRLREMGGALTYLNRKSRWNWGFIGEQTPYVTGSFAQGSGTTDGRLTFIQQALRSTQINRGVTGVLQYPFNRAHRVEFAAGMRRISFDREVETQFFSPTTGRLIEQTREELARPDALNLGEGSVALVYDSSLLGATSPILGQRYRFEYTQVGGSLLYAGVLGDYRRYFMPARPFTIALRGLHYGRYGRDSEDGRLMPLFIGYPGLVRGYDVDSFSASECVANARSTCSVFDQLVGSRIAIAGAELRFPLLGLLTGRSSSYYGPFPIEMAFFADAGTAWTSDTTPTLLGGDRDWVRSVGAALRLNAFGYAVLELDYVRPLDRPGRGWLWQFNVTQGF